MIANRIDELQEERRSLQAELEKEQSAKRELTQARDLAWDTYKTLQVKLAELGISVEMADVEVRFASPALEPIAPIDSNKWKNVILAGAAGLVLGVGVVFLLYYLDPEYDPAAAIGAFLRRPRAAD